MFKPNILPTLYLCSVGLLYIEMKVRASFSVDITYGNSGSLIGWINFHTFTCTGNIAMCCEPDPTTEASCLSAFELLTKAGLVWTICSQGRKLDKVS